VDTVARHKVKTLFGHGGCILNSVSVACLDDTPDAHSMGEVKLLFWFIFLVTWLLVLFMCIHVIFVDCPGLCGNMPLL